MQFIEKSRGFQTLDGIRGIAALSIAILHIPHFLNKWHLAGSFLAVDLFFILSGFVLANAYEARFAGELNSLSFLRLRLIRLYPLYLLGSLIGIVVAIFALHHSGLGVDWNGSLFATTLPLSAVMLPTPKLGNSDVLFPLNPVLWSIFFELAINTAYAASYPLFRRTHWLVCLVVASGLVLCGLAAYYGSLQGGYSWETFPVGLARVTFSFGIGVLIFRRFDQSKRRTSNLSVLLIALIPVIFAIAHSVPLQVFVVLSVLPAVVWGAVHVEPRYGNRLFNTVGVASYALYALHKPVYQLLLGAMDIILPFRPEELAPWLGLIFLPLMILICVIVDKVYDAPFRRWLAYIVPSGPC